MKYLDPQKFDVEYPYFSDTFSSEPDFVIGQKFQPKYSSYTFILDDDFEWTKGQPEVFPLPIYNLRLALEKIVHPLVFVDSEAEADFLNNKLGDDFVFVCCKGGFIGAKNANLEPIKDRDIFVLKPDTKHGKQECWHLIEILIKKGSFVYADLEILQGMGGRSIIDCWDIVGGSFKAMARVSMNSRINIGTKTRMRQDQASRAFILANVKLAKNKGLVYLNNQWLRFNGKCYEPMAKEAILQSIKEYLTKLGQVSICSTSFLQNVATQIRAELKNGLFRIRTNGTVQKICNHTPDFFSLNSLNFEYKEGAKCERWLKFLDEVIPESKDQALLQEWFGYHFCHTLQLRKYLTLFGRGANGKSVVLSVLRDFIGPANCSSVDLDAFTKEFYLSETYGKMANISDEMPAIKERLNHGMIKKFMAGEEIFFNPKGRQGFTAPATAKWTQATNELPFTSDSSNGVIDRTQVIFMNKTIPEDRRNPEMAYIEYWNKDYPGIFNWALEGFKRILSNKQFTKSTFHEQMISTIQENSAPEVQWLKDNYKESPGCRIARIEIWNNYKKFAHENDYTLCPRKKLFEAIMLNFPSVEMAKQNRISINGTRQLGILNLGTIPAKEKP